MIAVALRWRNEVNVRATHVRVLSVCTLVVREFGYGETRAHVRMLCLYPCTRVRRTYGLGIPRVGCVCTYTVVSGM